MPFSHGAIIRDARNPRACGTQGGTLPNKGCSIKNPIISYIDLKAADQYATVMMLQFDLFITLGLTWIDHTDSIVTIAKFFPAGVSQAAPLSDLGTASCKARKPGSATHGITQALSQDLVDSPRRGGWVIPSTPRDSWGSRT